MKLKRNQLWKSLSAGLKSHGGFTWEIGKWYKTGGTIEACNNGFHGSKRIIDAMQYVNCECLAIAEVKGKSDKSEKNKEAWQQMKLVKVYKWEKEHSVKLAIFAAEQVIGIYEKQYPNDNRPRKAIEAAKAWLANPTEENRQAAYAAADAATYAATYVAKWAAKWPAYAAADAATYAATYVAKWAAKWAAYAAKKTLDKCERYILTEILPTLKEIN